MAGSARPPLQANTCQLGAEAGPQSAGFVAKQHCRPVRLLVVRCDSRTGAPSAVPTQLRTDHGLERPRRPPPLATQRASAGAELVDDLGNGRRRRLSMERCGANAKRGRDPAPGNGAGYYHGWDCRALSSRTELLRDHLSPSRKRRRLRIRPARRRSNRTNLSSVEAEWSPLTTATVLRQSASCPVSRACQSRSCSASQAFGRRAIEIAGRESCRSGE